MADRRPLTDHEKAVANTMKAAWLRKKSEEKITQEVAGDALGMSAAGFSQYINAKVAMGLPAQIQMAAYLGVSLAEIGLGDLQSLLEGGSAVYAAEGENGRKGSVVEVKAMEISVFAGSTGVDVHISPSPEASPVYYKASWLKEKGLKAENLLRFKVSGSSMEPSLYDGDWVTVDLASRTPKNGTCFVVNIDESVCIKRLRKQRGEWWISSDNPAYTKHDTLLENAEQIIGMAVDKSSTHI